MFVLINEIGIENLPDGQFRVRSIPREEAARLILEHREQNKIIGAFDFGPVPNPRKEAKFKEVLQLLKDLDLPLQETDFGGDAEAEGTVHLPFVVAPQFCRLQEDRPILVICYGYRLGPGTGVSFTPILEGVEFRLFEMDPADHSGAIARPASSVQAVSRSKGEIGGDSNPHP